MTGLHSNLRLSSERLRKVTLVIGGVFGIMILLISGSALGHSLSAGGAKSEEANLTKETTALEATIMQSKRLSYIAPSGKTSNRIPALVDEVAKANQCDVKEYQAAGDVQPFSSKFDPQAENKGWNQTAVQVQIEGPMGGIFEIVRAISSASTPTEFDLIELAGTAKGSNQVTAKLTFRILSMEKKK